MMGFDFGIGLFAALLCMAFLPLLLVGGVYLVVREFGPRNRRKPLDSARETLDRRLALGEISPEEYYEREAVLRSADPGSRAGRKLA